MRIKVLGLLLLMFVLTTSICFAANEKYIRVTLSCEDVEFAKYTQDAKGNVSAKIKKGWEKLEIGDSERITIKVSVRGAKLSLASYSWNNGELNDYKATIINTIKPAVKNRTAKLRIKVVTDKLGTFDKVIEISPKASDKNKASNEEKTVFDEVDFAKYTNEGISLYYGSLNGYGAKPNTKYAHEICLNGSWYNLEQNENAILSEGNIGQGVVYEKVITNSFNGIRIVSIGKTDGVYEEKPTENVQPSQVSSKEIYSEVTLKGDKGSQCMAGSGKTATASNINLSRGDIVTININRIGDQVDKIDVYSVNYDHKYSVSDFPVKLFVDTIDMSPDFYISFRYIDKNGNYIINENNEIVTDKILDIKI